MQKNISNTKSIKIVIAQHVLASNTNVFKKQELPGRMFSEYRMVY